MAFPASPSDNEVHKEGNQSFVYDSTLGAWDQVKEIDRSDVSSHRHIFVSAGKETVKATGGDITHHTNSAGTNFAIHTFTKSGQFTPTSAINVQFLIIGGGGGGGTQSGAGGGAGGYRSNVPGQMSGGGSFDTSTLSLSAATNYEVIVGAGGVGEATNSQGPRPGTNGGISAIVGQKTSEGGGGGASYNGQTGIVGGSGGGGAVNGGAGGAGTGGQGYAGGTAGTDSNNANDSGGGGGGAGGVGESAGSYGTDGGIGVSSDITGVATFRAGGGGGAGHGLPAYYIGLGGKGGGGNSGAYNGNNVGVDGAENTGGGGGSGSESGVSGGDGGSGIVIIRYTV